MWLRKSLRHNDLVAVHVRRATVTGRATSGRNAMGSRGSFAHRRRA
jgi:hypothetical protein